MRLTKVVNKGMNETPIYVGSYGNIVNVGDNQATSMVHNKLGQLEDIEEELGIELITLFRIIKTADAMIRNGKHGESYVSLPDGTTFNTDMGYVEEFIHRFKKLIKDYGKTWALTKEELIDEK